jgi:hypothetical protein
MVSVYFNGRLGNQIFQYLALRLSAHEKGYKFYICKNSEEVSLLANHLRNNWHLYIEDSRESNPHYWIGDNLFDIDLGESNPNNEDFKFEHNQNEGNLNDVKDRTLLTGFFQSEHYFLDKRELIKSWIPIKPELIDKSKEIISKYPVDEYCYIHFRGGDYKDIHHWFLPKSYYLDAFDKVSEIKSDLKCLVITDDYDEAKKTFPDFEVISNEMETDFCLLYQSKYTIIPNSSFSWWASWLNDNNVITIAPERWFNYNNGGGFEPFGIKSSRFTYIDKK